MRTRVIGVGAALLLALAGCSGGQPPASSPTTASPSSAPTSETPTQTPSSDPGVEIVAKRTDIVYADDGVPEHKLDLYMPTGQGNGPFPTIVWVHGGGWAGGEKGDINNTEIKIDQFRDVLLDNGYAIAAVEYRLMPKVKFPVPMQDVAAAVRYLKAKSGEYGLDPDRFVLGGDSAGGHLATMTAMTWDKPDLQGTLGITEGDTKVKAIVDYYAIFDLTNRTEDQQNGPCQRAKPGAESSHGQLIGADPDSPEGEPIAAKASPMTYVNAQTPPTIIFYGTEDCTTPPAQHERFYQALHDAGVPVQITRVDGAAHANPRFFETQEYKDKLIAFLKEHV